MNPAHTSSNAAGSVYRAVLGLSGSRQDALQVRSRLDKAIAIGLIVAVVFTTLAHGAVEPWSVALFELIVVALIMLWTIKSLADRRLAIVIPPAALPVAALILCGLAQSVALTDSTGRTLSRSMNVEASRASVVVLFALFVSFIGVANFFNDRERLRLLANFLVIYGLVLAVFALVQHFAWDGRFYWLRPTDRDMAFGPFANRNHFAGYMEMLVTLPVGLVIARGVRRESWVFYGFAAAMMGVASTVSLSRGGMISLAAGMIFLLVMSVRLPRRTRDRDATADSDLSPRPEEDQLYSRPGFVFVSKMVFVVAIAAAIVAGIVWIGLDPVVERIRSGRLSPSETRVDTFFTSRGWIWGDTLEMIRANPITGVGIGAFRTAYPIYEKGDGTAIVAQAHNDYLEILASCGIIGGAIAVWFIVVIFRAVARGIRSADPLLSGIALGSGGGIFALLVHSLFDFNLQLPSNALLFLLLSAVASHVGSAAGQGQIAKHRAAPHVGQ